MPRSETNKKGKGSSIHCMWGLVCSLSSIDQQKNNVSLFEVIDQINLPENAFSEKPTPVALRHELVSQWRRIMGADIDDREIGIDIAIELIDSNEHVLQRAVASHVFPKGMRRLRIRNGFGLFPVTMPGDYSYRVSFKLRDEEDFTLAQTVHIEVRRVQQP